VRGLAVCADSLGSEGGHFAVFGNLEFGCADFLASFLQGCFVVIGVNFLDGDGIGAAGHGAGSGIVFAVELHSEAMGNGATVGVFALHGAFGAVGGLLEPAWDRIWI